MSKSNFVACPICDTRQSNTFFTDDDRQYYRCPCCDLIFVPTEYHLSDIEEKSRYDSHNNDSSDYRYRNFLNQLLVPLVHNIPVNSYGLDFGSGPGPTLSLMLQERGYKVDLYDKFYAQDETVFQNHYDFVTATEVFEHLSQPMKELRRLVEIIKEGGILAIMTELTTPKLDFKSWYYKNDPSHICFFSNKTFAYLAHHLGLKIVDFSNRAIILKKSTKS